MNNKNPSRSIAEPVKSMLWGKSAGRCQFSGCNRLLCESDVTREQVNIAQKAHIWAFSADGPRGNSGIEPDEINSSKNLMLLCHPCHRLIDQDKDGDTYTVELLKAMKAEHEARVELATSISPEKQSTILLYGANIGSQSSPLSYEKAANAMLFDWLPKSKQPIILSLSGSPYTDSSDEYWSIESGALEKNFNQYVRQACKDGAIGHLSVFGLAPQPLLIKLGCLLSDIPAAQIYQLHREPPTWAWVENNQPLEYVVSRPSGTHSTVALSLSLSARISSDRITSVLGKDVSIWDITIENPHNDCIKSIDDLSSFRQVVRSLLDEIKLTHGEGVAIHVFPAMPVSTAIELGRVRMPKTAISLHLYDENRARGGFFHVLDV